VTNADLSQQCESAVCIGDRRIAPGRSAYIIAEAGVNHGGSVEAALAMVDVAAAAGADAFKVQVFRAAELATPDAQTAAYQSDAGGSQREMLSRLELDDDALARIQARCEARRIEFLATPFGQDDVRRLVRQRARAIKIASTDIDNTLLLEVAAKTGLPLIVSTGAATRDEIDAAVGRLREWGAAGRLVLLHCVSSYPTPLEAANLRAVAALRETFGVPSGFSDHTLETQTGALAVAAGACMLEKHFTLDRRADGPDHALSLEPEGLREYVSAVRQAERALGSGRLGLSDIERDVRHVARRSIVAARDLAAGAVLREDMLALKRPAGGLPPAKLDALLGRRLRAAVPRDTRLTMDLLE
jgi:sialic acid synthase SpsE